MVGTNFTLQTTAERKALKKAMQEHPSAKARVIKSYEHFNDGVWIVQVEVKDKSATQTPFYSFDRGTDRVQNVFPQYSNLLK